MVLFERAAGERRSVYFRCRKVTQGDLFMAHSNRRSLATVHKTGILITMSDQNPGKLNRLLAELGVDEAAEGAHQSVPTNPVPTQPVPAPS